MDMDSYIAGLPDEARRVLILLRETIQAAAPEAEPGMSYGVPAFFWRGKPLVCFAAFKNHYGLYPLDPSVLDAFREELSGFSTAKGTIRFPIDGPVPLDLVERIVKYRLEQSRPDLHVVEDGVLAPQNLPR